MTDHRRLQRTLFRMQVDPAFAESVFTGRPTALQDPGLQDPGLDEADLALLRSLDPEAVRADARGERRLQILGNATSEFRASLAAAARHPDGADLLAGFPSSAPFHRAIATDGRLPLAFAEHGRDWSRTRSDPALESVLDLEAAMAELRREFPDPFDPPRPERLPSTSPHPPGEDRTAASAVSGNSEETSPGAPAREGDLRLSARARLLELPAGTLDWTEALLAGLPPQAGAPRVPAPAPAPAPTPAAGTETVLLVATPRANAFRLAEARAERLQPPADELMRRAARTIGRQERARFAVEVGANPEDLEAFLEPFLSEGALEPVPASPIA